MEHCDDNLPQYLCTDCLRKLEDAYAFVLQARQVQEQLLHQIRKGLQCLDEAPIDIATQQIKTEADIALELTEELDHDEVATVSLKLQPESETDSDQVNAADVEAIDIKSKQLRRSHRKIKLATDSENEASSEISNPIPLKRRRGRPARIPKKETINQDGRHECEVCGKSFSWHRDMQRHARIHFEQAGYVCDTCGKRFLRKDKYMFHLRSHEKRQAKQMDLQLDKAWIFAERLYSSDSFKRIECKLCGLKWQKIQELREHLNSHVDIESLMNLNENSDVIMEQFANTQLDLNEIKQQVCEEITKGNQLDKYCAVVNAHGYELCLSDSDEEIDGKTPPYQCVPCNSFYSRKHLLIQHTLKAHTQTTTDSTSLHRCNHCQIGFVSLEFLKQHQSSQCHNQLKRYSCSKCPGKFIWLENLKQHECIQQSSPEKESIKSRHIQCCLCDEQLKSMSELRIHLVKHSDGVSGIDPEKHSTFFRCNYPDGFNPLDLSTSIAADFKAQDYGRYFNACTESGQELDFFDSDTDLSDSSATTLHSCDLCGMNTKRLSKLLSHQQDQHSELKDALPHVCDKCGLGFVADSLLQQHRRCKCNKQHAKYNCEHCHLQFIWESNYERHLEIHHEMETEDATENIPNTRLRSKRQETAKLKCNECEKVFIWPKDLTRHKRIHQPSASAQFECSHCDRKFHRKDGLKSHMRVHAEQQLDSTIEDPSISQRMPMVLSQLSQPNGCKQIQCMICLSQHSKISDLRTHLMKHQYVVELEEERVGIICRELYPEQLTPLDKQQLIERIQRDVTNKIELERFISITNEAGIELSLDSSETDTDSDSTEVATKYKCDLCQLNFTRKYEIYQHQLEQHTWQQATYICSHCPARFINDQLLEHHYRSLCRNPIKRFQCRKCPLRFRWRQNLKLHTNVAHQDATGEQLGVPLNGASLPAVISYDCSECNRSFKMQKDLTRHTLMHSQESSIYRCRWCARRFYRQANLLQHIERHGITASQLPYAESLLNSSRHPHGQKSIQCKVCNLSFSTIATLRSHLTSSLKGTHHELDSMLNYSITNQLGYELHLDDSETDEEVKPAGIPSHYTCSMCQLKCVRKYELHQHQQAMHRLERITAQCDQCIYKSVSPDLISYHKRVQCGNVEKQFKCVNCNFKFMWESNLLLHIQLQHPSNSNQEEVPPTESTTTENQIFQCGQCPRKYNRKDRLTAHVKKCHAVGATPNPTKATTTSTVSKQQKSFLCAFCGKAVSSSSNLIIHIRRHTGEKPFKCDFCDMAFPRSSDLQCHRRTHTGERPHVCTVCQKGFARSYKLQQHMRIHNGERPYKCTYCDKSFTQSNDLTLHIRRHTGERPYQCDTCGERFIQGTALKNHRLQNGHFEAGEGMAKDN